jgi:hypothetical protein
VVLVVQVIVEVEVVVHPSPKRELEVRKNQEKVNILIETKFLLVVFLEMHEMKNFVRFFPNLET